MHGGARRAGSLYGSALIGPTRIAV
jgi:hypothetical protein